MSRHIAGRGRARPAAPEIPDAETVDCDLTTKLTLGQFLKLADLIDSGADAKDAIATGAVTVNGEVDTRRGRGLADGDVVELSGRRARVNAR